MKHLILIAIICIAFVLPASAADGDVTLPLCSAAVHDSYKTTGPDGLQYPTWHPQIDPSGCHFNHEHGSNPALFDPALKPAFGYSITKAGQTEGHAGFKVYVFSQSGYTFRILHHFGTGNAALAACVQRHTFDVAVQQAGALVADIHIAGDFGQSVDNVSGAVLTPPNCPNQGTINSLGRRRLPVVSSGNVGYEPWRLSTTGVAFLEGGDLNLNTPNAQTACDTLTCTTNVARTDVGGPARGTVRFLTFNTARGGFSIHATQAYSNTFYTDPTGTQPRLPTDTDAVKQYIAPGLSFVLPFAKVAATDAHAYIYLCNVTLDETQFRQNVLITGAN